MLPSISASHVYLYFLPKYWYLSIIFLFHCFVVPFGYSNDADTKSTVILKGIIRKQKGRLWLQDRQRFCQPVAQLSNMKLWWDRWTRWWAMKLWRSQGDTWRLTGPHCDLCMGPGTLQPPAAICPEPRWATDFISCHSRTWVYRTGCLLCKYSLS